MENYHEDRHAFNGVHGGEQYEVENDEEEYDGHDLHGEGGDGKDHTVDGQRKVVRADESASSIGKIFVGGVAWETTEETFHGHFEKYGEITDSVIMKDKHTRTPRGFGFVTFADPYVIDKVLEDEHVIDGRTVEVKRTVPREEMSSKDGPKTRKIFVGGLPTSLSEDELKEHFSLYGKVVEHQIMLDHSTGRSRGFGFVTFESEEAVEAIILDGRMHDLGGKQVEVKKAEPKRSSGFSGASSRGQGSGGSRGPHRSNGGGGGTVSGGDRGGSGYGYSAGYRSSGGDYYGGGSGYGYARSYAYGTGNMGFGSGFGAGYGGSMYASGGYGGYGAYGASTYGGNYGGSAYGGNYGGPPGGYGSSTYGGGARAYGRYHPYSK